jgi:transposase
MLTGRQNKDIIKLYVGKQSYSEIADKIKCAKSTVSRVIDAFKKSSINLHDLANYSDEEILTELHKKNKNKVSSFHTPDFISWEGNENQNKSRNTKKKSKTIKAMYDEYVDECRQNNFKAYKQARFYTLYRKYKQTKKIAPSMVLEHTPGLVMQVDWAGTKANVRFKNGDKYQLSVFISVLPYSGYTFACAKPDESSENWIKANISALKFYDGVPHQITCDNLKTGIISNKKTAFKSNEVFQKFSDHYCLIINPTRPRKPRDKGKVEKSVKDLAAKIVLELEEDIFENMQDVDNFILTIVKQFNSNNYQTKNYSRYDLYLEEKFELQPLKNEEFKYYILQYQIIPSTWDVRVYKKRYSVPHKLIGEKVEIKIFDNFFEIWHNHEFIVKHTINKVDDKRTVILDHAPKSIKVILECSPDLQKEWAEIIGPNTLEMVMRLLDQYKGQQHGLRVFNYLKKIQKKYSSEILEECANLINAFKADINSELIERIIPIAIKNVNTTVKSSTKFDSKVADSKWMSNYFDNIKD